MKTNYSKAVCTLASALALAVIIGSSAVLVAPETAWAGKKGQNKGPHEIDGDRKSPSCGTPEAKNSKGPCELGGAHKIQRPINTIGTVQPRAAQKQEQTQHQKGAITKPTHPGVPIPTKPIQPITPMKSQVK